MNLTPPTTLFLKTLDRLLNDATPTPSGGLRAVAGHNGPYHHPESSIRNTAHLLMACLSAAKLLPDEARYRDQASALLAHLLSPEPEAWKDSYVFRRAGADSCNGVIGAAWAIEALARAGRQLQRPDALKRAQFVYARHRFHPHLGAWSRFDALKGPLSVDYTYNHQAWLAASAADLGENEAAQAFVDASHRGSLRTRADGCIHHVFGGTTPKNLYNRTRYRWTTFRNPAKVRLKEEGYHLFNLFALSRLRAHFPTHPLFVGAPYQSALRHCDTAFFARLESSPYAYPYNAPGFEWPLIRSLNPELRSVGPSTESVLQRQFEHGGGEEGLFTARTADPATLRARVYELGLGLEAERK
jgi:hypothetical protein